MKSALGSMAVLCAIALSAMSGRSALVAAQTPQGFAQPARDGATQKVGTAIIRGRVVTAGSDAAAPIRSARVSISGSTALDPVFTDGSGRFELTGLAAGRYILTAEKTGFAKTRYGSKNDLDPALPVSVADAAIVEGVEIKMPRGAAILGRVVDELGDPVVGATVSVGFLQASGSDTRLVPISRPASDTNDRGEYRIGGLAPGRYYLNVAGSSQGFQLQGAPPEWSRTISWVQTFYQTASTLAGATPVVLSAGEERAGVDFTLVPSRPATLTLSLTDAAGNPASGLINLLLPADVPGGIASNRGVPLSPGNPKMTSTLAPGEWIAVALGTSRALAHVKLTSGEEASVTLTPVPGARIAGRVVFDGSTPPPVLTSVRLGVRGVGVDGLAPPPGLSNGPVAVKPDGTFEISAVVGTIALQPTAPVRGWTLRAVRYGDRDLLDEPLTLTGSEEISGVQVVFTDQLAELSGTAVDAQGQLSPGCAVALFPDAGDLRAGSRRARLQRADQYGRFTMTDLLAGSYLAAAGPDVDAAVWLTADYRDRLRPAATRVTLADHEKKAITLPCTSLP